MNNVISTLDRDQGDAVILGIIDPKTYPFMTNWSYKENREDDIKHRFAEVFDQGEYVWDTATTTDLAWVRASDSFCVSLDLQYHRMYCFAAEFPATQEVRSKFSDVFAAIDDPDIIELEKFYDSGGRIQSSITNLRRSAQNFNPNLCPLEDIDWIDSYTEGTENILVLSGVAGTGKTYLAKHIVTQDPRTKRVATTLDDSCLRSPGFWEDLSGKDVAYLILDDVDDNLEQREGNQLVRNLLTFCDGVDTCEIKVIVTTNKKSSTVDEAIIRPGRCFDIFEMEPLTREKALHSWLTDYGKTEEEFEYFMGTEAVVSAADVVSCSKRTVTRRRRNFRKIGVGF